MSDEYTGVLCIGDPHLASRVPGFRKDDYPQAILKKLEWSLDYASANRLLPVVLGDLFHTPRDNANWMLVRLMDLFNGTVLGIMGNHDCRTNELAADDTLSVLRAAGRLRLLEHSGPWHGRMAGQSVIIGGTAWGQPLPTTFNPNDIVNDGSCPIVVWFAHHDIKFPGYEEVGRFGPREIPGIDILINGHIHRPLADVIAGTTTWINPGNIARVSRSDANRERRPSILRINIRPAGWDKQAVEVPYDEYAEVFHQEIADSQIPENESSFIKGLATLESFKTHGGEGLKFFLEQNLGGFDKRVATEIQILANEVYGDEFDREPTEN